MGSGGARRPMVAIRCSWPTRRATAAGSAEKRFAACTAPTASRPVGLSGIERCPNSRCLLTGSCRGISGAGISTSSGSPTCPAAIAWLRSGSRRHGRSSGSGSRFRSSESGCGATDSRSPRTQRSPPGPVRPVPVPRNRRHRRRYAAAPPDHLPPRPCTTDRDDHLTASAGPPRLRQSGWLFARRQARVASRRVFTPAPPVVPMWFQFDRIRLHRTKEISRK